MGHIILHDSLVFRMADVSLRQCRAPLKMERVLIIFPPIHFKVSFYSSVDESNGEAAVVVLLRTEGKKLAATAAPQNHIN